jgi:hypothetical protein
MNNDDFIIAMCHDPRHISSGSAGDHIAKGTPARGKIFRQERSGLTIGKSTV